MPRTGVPNNAGGENGWQNTGTEEPYGQKTADARLAAAAPVAGGAIASGPIQAPKRAGRRAATGGSSAVGMQPSVPPEGALAPSPTSEISADVRLANQWAQLAAIPGASDLVKMYAAVAAQRVAR